MSQTDGDSDVDPGRYRYELEELVDIARALAQERDINQLLGLILEKSRHLTGADAGSIYVVEGNETEGRRLRFKLSQNDSCSFSPAAFTLPVSMASIAGAAAVTRRPISIVDVYELPLHSPGAPYGFDRTLDDRTGYRTGSVMAVPMISAEEEVIAVIQLINKKRAGAGALLFPTDFTKHVIPFDARSEMLLCTLAAQAGIALENAMLYEEVRRMFDGFVQASVHAIEQRDPTTSGHSVRVSRLSLALAREIDRTDSGPYSSVAFSTQDLKELEYAAMLHDFGKIGVREQVLVKAKKLHPHELALVRARIDYAAKQAQVTGLARKLALVKSGHGDAALRLVDDEYRARCAELEDAWQLVLGANEPTVLRQGDFSRIADIGAKTYLDASGETRSLLTPDEVRALQVTKGSLDAGELEEIRSHVAHTYDFLVRIPWSKSFAQVPRIAAAHHERMDGTGYPRRLRASEIPVQSRIMSVADIYDALSAGDRPYKKSLSAERALDMLSAEASEGHLDTELVRVFAEAGIYKLSGPSDERG